VRQRVSALTTLERVLLAFFKKVDEERVVVGFASILSSIAVTFCVAHELNGKLAYAIDNNTTTLKIF